MSNLKQIQEELNRFRSTKTHDEEKGDGISKYFNLLRRNKSAERKDEATEPLIVNSDQDENREPDCSFSDIVSDDESIAPSEIGCQPWTRMDYIILTIKLTIYAIGQTIAILTQFGAVFFALSVFYLIWTNLSDRRRRRGELSAYSVFNPNCKQIHGSVTAEKLQGELSFGALHF
jgi:hypothetical protein